MIEFREVTRDNVNALIKLKLAEGQSHLIAPNAVTLAQAAHEPGAHVRGIYDGARPVGLLALLDPRDSPPWMTPQDDPGALFLWRLMIAADEQGKGYGTQAIALLKAQARDWGLPQLAASVVDVPDSPMAFYEALGFVRTGKIIDDEIVISVAARSPRPGQAEKDRAFGSSTASGPERPGQ